MKTVLVFVLTVSLMVSGCVTTRTVIPNAASADLLTEIHTGDQAKILLKSGEVRKLKISAVDSQTITGEVGAGTSAMTVQIALADVQSLEFRRVSGLRTTGLVVVSIVGAAALLLAAIVAECGNGLQKCSE